MLHNQLYGRRRVREAKRKQRLIRLLQIYDLLDRRDEIIREVWGWKARRRRLHAMAKGN